MGSMTNAFDSRLATQRASCERDLARLERLDENYRFRVRVSRGLRAVAGFTIALAILLKTKIVATLTGKLVIAALVALGFAVPTVALLAIIFVIVVGGILALISGEGAGLPDIPDCTDCTWRNRRRDLLLAEIKKRRTWLDKPAGAAPRRRMYLRPLTKS